MVALFVVPALLSGCGGGGDGGTAPPPPSGNITVSGTVTFDRPTYTVNDTLNFTNTERLPVRGATVEILRASDQAILATTTTDGTTGQYSASIANVAFIVRVKAQLRKAGTGGYDFEVRNNTSGNALYTLDSATISPTSSNPRVDLNAPTGWVNGSYVSTRAAAPFAILDMLWEARLLLQAAETALTLPALDVHWSTLNHSDLCEPGPGLPPQPDATTGALGTTFYLGGTIPAAGSCGSTPPGIYVLGDASGGFDDDPDEFDSSVIAHELGHYYLDAFSRDESMGGPHYLDSRHDLRLAFSEGWGNAFQGFVLDSPMYRDTFGATGSVGFAFDMENDTDPYSVATGFFAEASIHEFLWDAYDGTGEAGDQMNLGFAAIHAVMRQDLPATAAMASVFPFATGLETRNPAQQVAIRSRLSAEGINGTGDFAVGQTLPGHNDLVPVFVPVVTLGAPVQVISTNRFADTGDALYQSYNRLGGRRYLTFDLPVGGGLRITAQGPAADPFTGAGSDPDFLLYRDGVDQCVNYGSGCSGIDDSLGSGLEEASYFGLPAGRYVLEVAECSYLGELCRSPLFGTNTAITVTVTPQ